MKNLNKKLKSQKMKKLKRINDLLEDDETVLPTKFIKTLEKQEVRVNRKMIKKIRQEYDN